MKKIIISLFMLATFVACSQKIELVDGHMSVVTANFSGTIETFIEEDTKASVTSSSFNWSENDQIGIWPLTVTPPQTPQQHMFSTTESGTATAVFSGSGWGLLTDGDNEYAAYFPYNDSNSSSSTIGFHYDSNYRQTGNASTSHIGEHLFMYAPAITPTNPEEASFTFKQIGCLLTFDITVPSGVTRGSYLVASFADPVFVKDGTYSLDGEDIIITPQKVISKNIVNYDKVTVPSGDRRLVFNMVVCPASVAGKEMKLTLCTDNAKYTATVSCNKDWISGKHYKYVIAAGNLQEMTDPTPVREGVDLGTGILWATTNIGATSIEDPGFYYQWGSNAAFKDGSTPDYYKDGTCTQLLATDDIANLKWNDATEQGWRMPTKMELKKLLDNCIVSDDEVDGTYGIRIYNKTDQSKNIFIPYGNVGSTNRLERLLLWSSEEKSTSRAYYLVYDKSQTSLRLITDQVFGTTMNVRPVKDLAIGSSASGKTTPVSTSHYEW